MTTASTTFDDAIRAIRLAAAAADPLPHDLPVDDYERGEAMALMPRLSFSFPVPGNPRGITVSAVDHRETLDALADKLETKARAFGGKPPKKVRKKTRTSGYQAARSAFAEGHHRQVHRALGDRLAFVVGKNGTQYPVMVVEEFERAGHAWAIAWPVSGKTRTPMLAHVATGTYGSITKEHGDIMGKDDEFFERLASGAPATAPALDQSAALESFLAADRVESMDADAIAESEPCDVADAHVALAEKIADDAAIHSGEDEPTTTATTIDPTAQSSEASYKALIEEEKTKIDERESQFNEAVTDLKRQHFRETGIFKGIRSKKARDEAFNDAIRELRLSKEREQKAILDEYRAKIVAHPYEAIRRAESARKTRDAKAQADSAGTLPEVTCDKASASPSPATDTPRLHQKLAPVPDQKAAHGAGSCLEATTENFTRTDSVQDATVRASRLSRHRTRWMPNRTEDCRRNPLQAEPIRNHNARRWREPWNPVATDPPRTRAGSMPSSHAVDTGARGSYPYHHSIQGCRLSMARKLHKPPDQKATHATGPARPDPKSWQHRRYKKSWQYR